MRRDNLEYPKRNFSGRFQRAAVNPRSAEPDETSPNASSRVLWEIEVTLAVWLFGAVIVELLFAAAR